MGASSSTRRFKNNGIMFGNTIIMGRGLPSGPDNPNMTAIRVINDTTTDVQIELFTPGQIFSFGARTVIVNEVEDIACLKAVYDISFTSNGITKVVKNVNAMESVGIDISSALSGDIDDFPIDQRAKVIRKDAKVKEFLRGGSLATAIELFGCSADDRLEEVIQKIMA